MIATYQTLFSEAFLRANFHKAFVLFQSSAEDEAVIKLLTYWSQKDFQKETSAEIAFIQLFFENMWGYTQSGKAHSASGYTCYPKYAIAGSGAGGGNGEADVALGFFGLSNVPPIPQVICEFKDVRSNLDRPQKRKGNNRSPVKQCSDYLREAMRPLFGNEVLLPTWGIVTDMNEFRLYWRNTMPSQYQRFIINKPTTEDGPSLLAKDEAGSFQRFLFVKLFHADNLLTKAGLPPLLALLKDQRYKEQEFENAFYGEYKRYREYLVKLLIQHNVDFAGTKGRLVRLAQKLIDRCIFIMFCEDMGERLSFPPNALRDYLSELSRNTTFEPDEQDAWNKLKELFHAMNEGKNFRARSINRFNGGLFASDPELETLRIPNEAFCMRLQGENNETLGGHPLTLLYFAGRYNFGAANYREGQAITLYMLGRIFEQSITELEALEATADERPSLTVISKRKRDGVYYTPEWIVERLIAETVGPRLDEIRAELGWSFKLEGDEMAIRTQLMLAPSKRSKEFTQHAEAVRVFGSRLDMFTVLDPACGSGVFLVHTLEYLLRMRRLWQQELALITGNVVTELFEFKADHEVREILSKNIFGVDINPSSIEIARLAIWLHTARADQPLSSLDQNIVVGNSLVGPEVFDFKKDLLTATDEKKESLNAFEYESRFPAVFADNRLGGAGFDCVIGNPPYVKFQNFKKVYPETADFLRNASSKGGGPRFRSCQSGNFDLFLPFIERGLELLNHSGRLGYIAPSLWRYNEYGQGVRRLLHMGGNLDRWIDFGSFQVFEEGISYTALQFYTQARNRRVRFALAPHGELALVQDWDDPDWYVTYQELPRDDPWIFVPRHERLLLEKMSLTCLRLDDKIITRNIYQGLITSADHVFHLERVGMNHYKYQPPKQKNEKKLAAENVFIEDSIMHALVSGHEVHRYESPLTNTYILFPYEESDENAHLMTEETLIIKYPLAWAFLKRFEPLLRSREDNGFDNNEWYQFGRTQSIDKQQIPKILIPRLCLNLAAVYDSRGEYFIDNVDVGGIEVAPGVDADFLTGILNSAPVNFVWKRIAKPFQNNYFSANKQFLAPIPIPCASQQDIAVVAGLSRCLTHLHSERRNKLSGLCRRLNSCDTVKKPIEWLLPSFIRSLDSLESNAPKHLPAKSKKTWAKKKRNDQIEAAMLTIQNRLRIGAYLKIEVKHGEMCLVDENTTILDSVFIDSEDLSEALIEWTLYFQKNPVTDKTTAKNLADKLCCVRKTNDITIAKQIEQFAEELVLLDMEINKKEGQLNNVAFKMYGLSSAEICLIQKS